MKQTTKRTLDSPRNSTHTFGTFQDSSSKASSHCILTSVRGNKPTIQQLFHEESGRWLQWEKGTQPSSKAICRNLCESGPTRTQSKPVRDIPHAWKYILKPYLKYGMLILQHHRSGRGRLSNTETGTVHPYRISAIHPLYGFRLKGL
ncbi:hypothetical protein H9659_12960 [Sporosarcina sp. Sa3CUA8]|uniref:Uncharacterized protein n=1 Tax=Sporosarcina gallistercoris TaxID=2762245 RepID=A0ABR8PM58_9BACL|nr:hypothetical protein [Sporosarcina gallistercoris]